MGDVSLGVGSCRSSRGAEQDRVAVRRKVWFDLEIRRASR